MCDKNEKKRRTFWIYGLHFFKFKNISYRGGGGTLYVKNSVREKFCQEKFCPNPYFAQEKFCPIQLVWGK